MTKEIVFNTSEGDWGQRLLQTQETIETLRAELKEPLRFETLLAEISARFINLPADQINNGIEAAQHRICEFLDLDRSALRQILDLDPGTLLLTHVYNCDDVVLGGGNVKKLKDLPPGCRAGDNANAFLGGFRLWEKTGGQQRLARSKPRHDRKEAKKGWASQQSSTRATDG